MSWTNSKGESYHSHGTNSQGNTVSFFFFFFFLGYAPNLFCTRGVCGIDLSPLLLSYGVFGLDSFYLSLLFFFFFFSIFSSFFFPLLNRETSFYDYSLLSTYFLSFTVLRSSTTAGVPTIIIRTRTPLTTTRTRTDRRTMPIRRRENHHTRHSKK